MRAVHRQWDWNTILEDDLSHLIRLAVREDFDRGCDVTSLPLLPPDQTGRASVRARQDGVIAGLAGIPQLIEEFHSACSWQSETSDGEHVAAGQVIGTLAGSSRDLLAIERIMLNYLSHLSGIATRTRQFVDAIAGTEAIILDTRKTIPGWRRLAKYAVRCGGGFNHRTGLYDSVLIKDNHLAALAASQDRPSDAAEIAAAAVERVRDAVVPMQGKSGIPPSLVIEIEVDNLNQFQATLSTHSDIVLLDNFSLEELRQAVGLRNASAPGVLLEASGGVTLATVRSIAQTGVERISVGQITHSAPALDLAIDWDWAILNEGDSTRM